MDRYPPKLVILLAGVILLGSIGGFLIYNIATKDKTETESSTPGQTTPNSLPNSDLNLPIDPKSSAVKSVGVLYLLSGIVREIKPASQKGVTGYTIEISTPTGSILYNKFFVTDESATIVRLDKQGKESKISLTEIKTGIPVLLNFYIDLQKQTSGQVTKVMIQPN